MAFWKQGRAPADVTRAAWIIEAVLDDGSTARAKLILSFEVAQPQPLADVVGNWAKAFAATIFAELNAQTIAGCEMRVITELKRCMSTRFPAVRSIQIMALHVVAGSTPIGGGLPIPVEPEPLPSHTSTERMTAVGWARSHTPQPGPAIVPTYPALMPPLPSDPNLPARMMTPSRFTPPTRPATEPELDLSPPAPISASSPPVAAFSSSPSTTSPAAPIPVSPSQELGQALTGSVADASMRLLLYVMRAYEAILRGVALVPTAAAFTSLAPPASARTSGPSRAWTAEIRARQNVHGRDLVEAVRREAAVATAFLAYAALLQAGVAPKDASRAIEAVRRLAFPRVDVGGQLSRYMYGSEVTLDAELARTMSSILDCKEAGPALREVFAPLLAKFESNFAIAVAVALRQAEE